MKKISLILFIFISSILSRENMDFGRTGFQLLQEPAGVASVSRGYTGAALGGDYSRYYNPALYSAIENYYLNFEMARQVNFSDMKRTLLEGGFSVDDFFMAISLSNFVIDDIISTDMFQTAPPEGDGSSSWQSSEASFSLGVRRFEFLDWGATVGIAFDQFENDIAYAVLFGFGLHGHFLNDKLSLGLSAINWGITSEMLNDGKHEEFGEGEKLPSTINGGVAYSIAIGSMKLTPTVDAVYTHSYDSLVGVANGANHRFSFPVGVEFTPISWFTARVGKRFNGASDIINFGFGVKSSVVGADMGFVVNNFDTSVEWKWISAIKIELPSLTEAQKEKREKRKSRKKEKRAAESIKKVVKNEDVVTENKDDLNSEENSIKIEDGSKSEESELELELELETAK
jgi:hypothetical protein